MEITLFLHVALLNAFAIVSLFVAPVCANGMAQIDPSVIVLSNPSQIHTTYSKNITFLIEPSVFKQASSNSNQESLDKLFQPEGYSIEMELLTSEQLSQQIQILFAARVGSATQSSGSNTLFEADFIDIRAFNLHKKHFRIVVPYENAIANTGIYLSVIGIEISENYNELKFKLTIHDINDNNGKKRCPFDCLGSGKCDSSTGQCICQTGYFDNDCSIQATEITQVSRFSINNNTTYPTIKWETSLDLSSRQQYFYYQRTKEAQGYLYFSLKQEERSMEMIQEEKNSIQVFYKNESFTLMDEQLNSADGYEIFLEKIPQESSLSEDITPILIGLRLNGQLNKSINNNTSASWYIAGLVFSSSEPSSSSSSSSQQFYFTSSITVLILSVIVSILSLTLLILLICLHRRMKKLDAAYQRAQSKKMIKDKQDQEVLSLIPILIFTQQLSDELKAKEGEKNAEDPVCPVCLCDFQNGDLIRSTYCPHYFHRDCLELWIQKQKTCPHCRNSLSPRTLKAKAMQNQSDNNMNYHKLEEENEDKERNSNIMDGINHETTQNNTNKVPLRINPGLVKLQPPMAIPLRQIDSYMEHIDEDVHNISEVSPFPQKPTSPSECITNNTESIKFYKRAESEYPMGDSGNYSRMEGAIEISQQSPDDVSMNKKYWLFRSSNTSLDSNSPVKIKPGIIQGQLSTKIENFEIDMLDPQMKEQPENENEMVQTGKFNDPNTETHICNFIINSERQQYSKNPSQIHSEICFGQNKEPGEVLFPSNQTITTRDRPHFKPSNNVCTGSFNSGVGSLRLIGQNENNAITHPQFLISESGKNTRQESDQKS